MTSNPNGEISVASSICDKLRLMKVTKRQYPDISDILARKAEGRARLAKLPLGEKIARMEALRERLAPFKRLREERAHAKKG
jgi:hypothetical protein